MRGSARIMMLGGSTGIGEATVEELARRKSSEVWLGIESVSAYGIDDFDIADGVALGEAVQEVDPTHLVYSVGVHSMAWLKDIEEWDLMELVRVNVYGFVLTMQALMELDRPVSVVAVTSDAAWRPMRTSLSYCASKAALEMAIKVASRELSPSGWRVNGVAPGKVADTPMTEYVDSMVPLLRGWSKEKAEAYEQQSSALGRPVTKVEVAEVICDVLFGPSAMTGEIVAVNGGR